MAMVSLSIGDQTLATKLNTAGKPVNLIIGGHSHTNLATATKLLGAPRLSSPTITAARLDVRISR